MRTVEFPVDLPHAKAVNETMAAMRRLRVSSVVVAVVLGGLAAVLFWLDHPWSYILGVVMILAAVVLLWVSLRAPRRTGTVQEMYAGGTLVPAVVARIEQRRVIIIALIDIATPATEFAHHALVTRAVRSLPGHTLEVGEKVPAVSVLPDREVRTTAETYKGVTPMPIAWGTRDTDVLAQSVQAVPEVEWTLLTDNISLADRVHAASDHQLLIDPHDVPAELRSRHT